MALVKMAQPGKTTNANNNGNANNNISSAHLQQRREQQVKPATMFHDFLGMKATTDSPVVLAPAPMAKATDARFSEVSPSASASVGASSGGGGGGAGGAVRGPFSSTSDLGSERQVGNHLEGIPYYGPRSEISGPEISNRLLGSKRSNSDTAFMGHESLESLHLMKMFRSGAGGERPRRSNEDEVLFGMQPMRPSPASLILQPPTPGSRLEGNASKWERSVPMIGSAVQYAPRGSHFVPFARQASSNRFKDTNVGPSVISQAAADEGSRTGIKGPGILSSVNASGGPTEKTSGVMPSVGRSKSAARISDPESSVAASQQGLASGSRQMTIFYAGQAHVFDDVHPNKADVIMSLAGSNGGSWSTTYSPKSAVKPVSENYAPRREADAVVNTREFRERIAAAGGNNSQGSGERISIRTGVPQGTGDIPNDARTPVRAAGPSSEDKREV